MNGPTAQEYQEIGSQELCQTLPGQGGLSEIHDDSSFLKVPKVPLLPRRR